MSLLSKFFNRSKFEKIARISILGPSQAGKTTFTRYLETGNEVINDPLPTLGIDYRDKGVEIDGCKLTMFDIGGQKLFQQTFWDLGVSQSDGIVYIIDATVRPENDQELFQSQLEQFNYALDIIPHKSPILFLLNKVDLVDKKPMKPDEFLSNYKKEKLHMRTISFMPTSGKYGTGVEEAMKWFVNQLLENMS